MVSLTKGVGNSPEGFTSRSADLQTGRVTPSEIIRNITSFQTGYMVYLTPKQFPFFASHSEVTISSETYTLLCPKQPFTVETEIISVGTSSFVAESNLIMRAYPQHSLATCRSVGVSVDLVSRKPIQLPDFFLEMFKELRNKDVTSGPRVVKLARPEEVLMCQGVQSKPFVVQVARKDVDANGHTNFNSYVEYCVDALEIHLLNNLSCSFNTGSLLLKNSLFSFRGESGAGDTLHVAFWDDKEDNSTVCFDISKSGKCIFQAKMQFYGKHVLDNNYSQL